MNKLLLTRAQYLSLIGICHAVVVSGNDCPPGVEIQVSLSTNLDGVFELLSPSDTYHIHGGNEIRVKCISSNKPKMYFEGVLQNSPGFPSLDPSNKTELDCYEQTVTFASYNSSCKVICNDSSANMDSVHIFTNEFEREITLRKWSIDVHPLKSNWNYPFYTEQEIWFRCTVSNFTIVQDIVWEFDLTDGSYVSAKILNETGETFDEVYSKISLLKLNYSNIRGITCSVKRIDSTTRYRTFHSIIVKESFPPMIQNTKKIWELANDQTNITINCTATGSPPPRISWRKNGRALTLSDPESHSSIVKNNTTIQFLTVPQTVTSEPSIVYTCIPENFCGTDESDLTVVLDRMIEVPIPLSRGWRVGTVILAVILITLSLGVVYSILSHMAALEKPIKGINKKMRIPIDSVSFGKEIASGNSGTVIRGTFKHSEEVIAIKKTKKVTTGRVVDEEFVKELNILLILARLGAHANVVTLRGWMYDSAKTDIFIVNDYCEYLGKFNSLERFLFDNSEGFNDQIPRPEQYSYLTDSYKKSELCEFSTSDLIRWCNQIATGMKHLAAHKIVHRDLAARNILLDKNGIAKISDLGLSKLLVDEENPIYQSITLNGIHSRPLPLKWLAPEALQSPQIFSTYSDIWAFGVMTWEIFNHCSGELYHKVGHNSQALFEFLTEENRLEKPKFSDENIYNMMKRCWNIIPSERPTFTELIKDLDNYLVDYTSSSPSTSTSPVLGTADSRA